MADTIKAPFPYFGRKSKVANLVWDRFGDPVNYVEPFCGSCAVLLGRPPVDGPRTETVNDANAFLANVWRALAADPEGVAACCDWPVNEVDLQARHQWLITVGAEHVQRLKDDPFYYNVHIAGWWLWGACQWIGSGWCGGSLAKQSPHLGDGGVGIHSVNKQRPHLGDGGIGVHAAGKSNSVLGWFQLIQRRLRSVRVCCGDWTRVCGSSVTVHHGVTAVFLDPPYTKKAGRVMGLYAVDSDDVGHAAMAWAVANGGDKRLRIALCGYEGEYTMPNDWECVAWKTGGGYGNTGKDENANKYKERIWFSPHCVRPSIVPTLGLF